MKILLVAPRTTLLYADAEIESILRSGNPVTPMIGNVTVSRFLFEVLASKYDVLWLCTHGTKDGILFSDGLLTASELTPLVRNRFSLVVLNTCDSIDVAQMIQNETESSVIATIREVPDREAFQTGALFARALSIQTVTAAYTDARPGNNRTYVHLAASPKKK